MARDDLHGKGAPVDCGARSDPVDPEPTLDVLADLQAGLLDDGTATRIRRRIREDPAIAARLATLDSVRHELRRFGRDDDSAPPVPPAVTARIESALRAEPHSRLRVVVAFVGALAAVVAITVGTVTLLRAPLATPQVAQPTHFPLADTQLLDLLRHPPVFGPLTDLRRRASCLAGLDYPASTAPLGATIIVSSGKPVVILLLPEDAPQAVRAVAVRATCNGADTGLLAETTFQRP